MELAKKSTKGKRTVMKTSDFMRMSVIKLNYRNGYIDLDDIEWMMDKIDRLHDELARQRNHEAFLLNELNKLGWFEKRVSNRRKSN